jgi:hypothetical protein
MTLRYSLLLRISLRYFHELSGPCFAIQSFLQVYMIARYFFLSSSDTAKSCFAKASLNRLLARLVYVPY